MAKFSLPDVGLLHQIFVYDPDTGELRNRDRPPECFSSDRYYRAWKSTGYVGRLATREINLYLGVSLMGRRYLAHRVIFKMVYGTEPPMIDHINGDKHDNRICNLRAATCAQNQANRVVRKTAKAGVKGVAYRADRNKYEVRIMVNSKRHYFGIFRTAEEAAEVAKEAYAKLQGEFAYLAPAAAVNSAPSR